MGSNRKAYIPVLLDKDPFGEFNGMGSVFSTYRSKRRR
jgi:hypothetical protein